MPRPWFFLFALGFLTPALAQPPPRQVLDANLRHLGVEGLAEWAEFESMPLHGPQLDVTFTARANPVEHTLFLWQRDVKAVWNVLLNGRKLGTLEMLAHPLVLALRVPAGTLRDGENRLTILRAPGRVADDIIVGEIAVEPQPREAALGRGTLDVTTTDAESGAALPCRITITTAENALAPLHVDAAQRLAVRTGVVYTGDGRARVGVSPGSYVVYAGRGFEYSVDTQRVTVDDGETKTLALRIRREVPTPGLVASDTHIHTLTFSRHGDATIDERMLTIAGEGIELAVATDHNHHTDYTESARTMGVSAHFRPVVGNEVTTHVGHFNAFPIRAGSAVPDASLTDWTALLQNIRTVTGAKVITLNHPRDLHENFIPFAEENFDAKTGALKKVKSFDCDAMEVVTSAAVQSDPLQLFRDWFALLNHGYRLAAIGASDTHQVSQFILGQARTYVASRAADPAHIDVDEICASYRGGRLLVSFGLLADISVDERFHVGDLATGLGDTLRVTVEVRGPSWVRADHVALFANGVALREQAIAPTAEVEKARVTWTILRPRHDVHLVAIATGPGVTAPYWEIAQPYQPTSKVFTPRIVGATNPVWIDADRDGKFTSAREYAAALVARAAGDRAKLQAALADCDESIALQARALAAAAPATATESN